MHQKLAEEKKKQSKPVLNVNDQKCKIYILKARSCKDSNNPWFFKALELIDDNDDLLEDLSDQLFRWMKHFSDWKPLLSDF